jgi:hypothetical protein
MHREKTKETEDNITKTQTTFAYIDNIFFQLLPRLGIIAGRLPGKK